MATGTSRAWGQLSWYVLLEEEEEEGLPHIITTQGHLYPHRQYLCLCLRHAQLCDGVVVLSLCVAKVRYIQGSVKRATNGRDTGGDMGTSENNSLVRGPCHVMPCIEGWTY